MKKSIYKNAAGQDWMRLWQDKILAQTGFNYGRLTLETSFEKQAFWLKIKLAKICLLWSIGSAFAPAYLLLDEDDRLIPSPKTFARAKEKLSNLVDYRILKGNGHGIEFFPEAWQSLAEMIEKK